MLGAVFVNWVTVVNCTLDSGDWRWRMTKVATNFTISSWYPDKKNDFRRHNALQWTLKSVEGAPRRWVTGPKVVGIDAVKFGLSHCAAYSINSKAARCMMGSSDERNLLIPGKSRRESFLHCKWPTQVAEIFSVILVNLVGYFRGQLKW
jgi:hypothetical protein